MKGFIVYPTYRIHEGKPFVYLFGRLENSESFLSTHSFTPYFFIRKSDLEKALRAAAFQHEETGLKTMQGEEAVRVVVKTPKDVPPLRRELEEAGIDTFEADIRFAYRFMLDKGLLSSLEIKGNASKNEPREKAFVDRVFAEPEITSTYFFPELRVVSIDIETDMSQQRLFCISLYSDTLKKTLMISDCEVEGCEVFRDEKALLQRFQELIIKHDPDIITGWNVIDFDLSFLKKLFSKHRIPFSLGRIEGESKLRIMSDFFRDSTADIAGRAVLDGIHLLKSSFVKLDDYRLGTAAMEFLGEKKLIGEKHKGKEIELLFRKDKKRLAEYNMKDAKLVAEILEESGVLKLTILRSLITGMQLDRVKASIASFDSLYLRELRKRGFVAPTAKYVEKETGITGGYVMQSKPGIYDYVIVLDFKSLYPSIMRTFNIDPLSYVSKPPASLDKKKYVKAPNGAVFRNEEGILPQLLQRLWEQREQAKKRNDRLASTAIKILMNSFFGVLASPNCRFFSMDIANAITTFGQKIIKLTAEKISSLGYEVIYGDTDSCFVNLSVAGEEDARRAGKKIQDEVNSFFSEHIKREYSRPNFLELEFEKVYRKFWMPSARGSDRGSKKRYAGLVVRDGKESIEFVGLEFVRRDWTDLAKKFQLAILDRVFHDKPVGEYIREFVKDLRSGKYDDLLVYRKAIRKSVDEYTKTTPPHVKAARKLGKLTSNIISYVMTVNGPEPVEALKSRIDYDHYVEKQLKPLAESILAFTGEKFEDFSKKTRQAGLRGFL